MSRIASVFLLLLLLAPPLQARAAQGDTLAVFDEVTRLVNQRFYDPTFGGRDWPAIAERYRSLAASAAPQDFPAIVNRMLGELGASHTAYLTDADPAYYDLADIFARALRRELPRVFSNGEVAYAGIGALTTRSRGKTFVDGILAGFPAESAGLRTGDEILAADGAPFDPIASFRGKIGQPVTLTIRRREAAPTETITVKPQRIRPNDAYSKAIESSARIIEADGRKIGYIRMWSYAGDRYQDLLEREVVTGALKDADALIWDLRGGWGGSQASYLDLFDPRGPMVVVTGRSGRKDYDNVKWRRPAVLLIDGGTRSGKEILAYGFKKYGFGPVVGTRTKGDVLAARAFMLSDGSLLELAVGDVRVDGERLEGVGVAPTVEVPFRLEYSDGADPQLERAVSLAAEAARG